MNAEDVKQHPIAQALSGRFGEALERTEAFADEVTFTVAAGRIADVCRFLKLDEKFERLSSVTAVDWHPREPRFEIVYHLHSVERNLRIRVKAWVGGEAPAIDSVYPVWRGADWYEREVFDLFGVAFRGHPNLQRLMMPEDWNGHPLRKDYPVHGYKYSYADQE